jgi:hypothetical protein
MENKDKKEEGNKRSEHYEKKPTMTLIFKED